ncbi:MAG TPA: ankyrin repeat domain-containing protein [bacterium]|nr:ankyrin repeat domain-containing protein [bacterium]
MPDNKEKDIPLFSDDLPKDSPKQGANTDSGNNEPITPVEEAPLLSPTVDESFSAPKDIFEAIQRKDLDIVVGFLEKKTNLAATNEEERTPLQVAASLGASDIVKLLVECGANIEAKGKDGRTPLMLALSNCHFDVTEYLLSKGANVNIASATNYTPLMQASAKGATEIVREMLPKIDNINAKNNEGRTALMIAVRFGHRDIIEMLLSRNASLQMTDNNGNSAVSLAETPDLKKYLAEKTEEERHAAEERAKGKEETITEEVKKKFPTLLVALAMLLLAGAAAVFAYYQMQNMKVKKTAIPPAMQLSAKAVARGYCDRVAECREGLSSDFRKRCATQAFQGFGEFLAGQGGEKCDQNRIDVCVGCLSGLPCERVKKLDMDYLERNCGSCHKACRPEN